MKKKKKVKKIRAGKARGKKSSPKTKPVKLSKKFRKYHELLLRKRDEILDTVKHKEEDITLGEIGDEADAASQTFEREMMFEMTNGERVVLDDIEAALRRIEKGEFGVCESCHKGIPLKRLKAMAWARNCIQCQSRTESHSEQGRESSSP